MHLAESRHSVSDEIVQTQLVVQLSYPWVAIVPSKLVRRVCLGRLFSSYELRSNGCLGIVDLAGERMTGKPKVLLDLGVLAGCPDLRLRLREGLKKVPRRGRKERQVVDANVRCQTMYSYSTRGVRRNQQTITKFRMSSSIHYS